MQFLSIVVLLTLIFIDLTAQSNAGVQWSTGFFSVQIEIHQMLSFIQIIF